MASWRDYTTLDEKVASAWNTLSKLPSAIKQKLNAPAPRALANFAQKVDVQVTPQARLSQVVPEMTRHPIRFAANFPKLNFAGRVQNPVARLGATILEATGNTPSKIIQNFGKTGQDIQTGDILTRQGATRFAGRTLGNVLDVAGLRTGKAAITAGSAALQMGKPALTQLFKQGAKQGAITGTKYGLGYGISTPLSQGETRLSSILPSAAQGALGGFVAGGVLGGTLPVLGALPGAIRNSMQKRTPTIGDVFASANGALPQPGLSLKDVAGKKLNKANRSTIVSKNPLLQEARKYKSAEEFVKANNENPSVLFRGIKKGYDVQGLMNETWATSDFDTALRYARKDGTVVMIPKPNDIKGGFVIENNTRQFQGKIKPTGNEKIVTKSQLTDIWNKAQVTKQINKVGLKELKESIGDALPPVGLGIKNVGQGERQRGFITTVKNSPNISSEVKSGVKGTYQRISNKTSFANADANINRDIEGAIQRAKKDTAITLQGQTEAIRLIDELQKIGRTQDAIDIVESVAKRATAGGQATQILSAVNRLKPEGVLLWAQRGIEKAKKSNPAKFGNLSLTPEKAGMLRNLAEEMQTKTGDEKTIATQNLIDEVAKIVPSTWAQKLTTLWKAGLLTGVKGAVGGNTVGNTANVILRKLSDVPASGIDTALSKITGQRSKVFTLKGLFKGTKEGAKIGVHNFKMGVGAEDLKWKVDYHKVYFDSPAIQKYVDTVFSFYSAADRPFYHSALENSLSELATVSAKNQGLKGKALKEAVNSIIKNPPENILTRALEEAKAAVFQDKTALGSALSGFKQGMKREGGAVGEIVSEAIAPFTGVPSSIATAVHRYSPTGAVQGVYKAIQAVRHGNFDQNAQRTLSEALGKGITGTGLIWLGTQLTKSGQMTLGYPTDAGERSLWEKEGKIPYAIMIGGKWRSLNYTGATMALLAIGAEIAKAAKDGGDTLSSIGKGLVGSGKAILSSSPLSGMQAGMDAITDPQRYGDKYFRNLGASIVPTIVKDFASAGDRTQREVNTFQDALKNRVPSMRNTLLPKRDIFGEEVPNPAGPISSIIDPFRSSVRNTDATTLELRRLQDAQFGPTLSKPDKKIKGLGMEKELTPEQLDEYEKAVGQQTKQALEGITASSGYKSLPDEQKQDIVNRTINSIRKAEKEKILLGIPTTQSGGQSTDFYSLAFGYDFGDAKEINPSTLKGALRKQQIRTKLLSLYKDDRVPEEVKQQFYQQAGVSEQDVELMVIKSLPNTEKARFVREFLRGGAKGIQFAVQNKLLTTGSTGTIAAMEQQGLITEKQADALTALMKKTTKKSTTGRSSSSKRKTKVIKYPKLSAPKMRSTNITAAQLFKIK